MFKKSLPLVLALACFAGSVQPALATSASIATSSRSPIVSVRVTAYTSDARETDGTPTITATGTRTRPGIIALSRDLLAVFPYRSRVYLIDSSGRRMGPYVVEDTMSARKRLSADVFMYSRSAALSFGARYMKIVRA